jgi:branched-chain amino acid transport system substrate-binding protein
MRGLLSFCAVAALGVVAGGAALAEDKPILIGADSPIQLQVGRDTVDALQMGIDEINAKGGVLGRKLQLVVADETMDPQQGVAAIKKLTSEEHVDVLIGGYNSGVTLAEEPHIADAKTIYLGIGSASPTITDFVGKNYKRFKYIFRVSPPNSTLQAQFLVSFATEKVRSDLHVEKIAIVGENAVWVQGLVPVLKAGIEKAGMQVPLLELFDPDMSDFSPLLAKVKDSGAQYMLIVLSHANSDVFVKQWYDAKFPIPMGGIDVKSQDPDFFKRIGGKAISEVVTNGIIPDAITPKTLPFWNGFVERYHRTPVYSAPGAYDALQIYVQAVERAKTTDPEKVIPELEKTAYVGTQGQYVFDKNHDVESGPGKINTLFVQWQEGGARVVVWPKEVSKGKMILPPWINQRAEAK